jgi:hypothetical protein
MGRSSVFMQRGHSIFPVNTQISGMEPGGLKGDCILVNNAGSLLACRFLHSVMVIIGISQLI